MNLYQVFVFLKVESVGIGFVPIGQGDEICILNVDTENYRNSFNVDKIKSNGGFTRCEQKRSN